MRFPTAFFLCLLSGVLFALAFPPFDWFFSLFCAPIPAFCALWSYKPTSDKPIKRALSRLSLGLGIGLTYYGISFWWIHEVSTLGYFPVVLYLSLYPALWALLVGGPFAPKSPAFPVKKEEAPSSAKKKQTSSPLAPYKIWSYADMRQSLWASLLAAALWVVLEWLRSLGPFAFTWNNLALGLPLSYQQLGEYIGATGLTFLPIFVGGILWSAGRRVFISITQSGKRVPQWDFLFTMSALCLLFVWGVYKTQPDSTLKKTFPLTVLLIQQNTPLKDKWNPALKNTLLHGYLNATQKALQKNEGSLGNAIESSLSGQQITRLQEPDWIIYPESSFPWPLYYNHGRRLSGEEQPNEMWLEDFWAMVKSYQEKPVTLISGMDEAFFESPKPRPTRLHNSLFAYKEKEAAQFFRKSHLVPFGEYIPLRKSLPILEKAFEYSSGMPMGADYSAGTKTSPLTLKAQNTLISVIPTICFEDTLPSQVRRFVRTEHPQVILNLTNDGWFNESAASAQHFANAKMRAIETRRPLIRAANTGISAFVNEQGVSSSPFSPEQGALEIRDSKTGSSFIQGSLLATIPLALNPPMTLYAQWGDWFALQALFLVLFALFLPFLRRKKQS